MIERFFFDRIEGISRHYSIGKQIDLFTDVLSCSAYARSSSCYPAVVRTKEAYDVIIIFSVKSGHVSMEYM